MVMDATPSPQSVGREFVRQYYTLLNKAPNHLHRFYNNSSSFVHGGLDLHNREAPIVVGQKQIHNKIQQLNFRDCHAKISQVDSQATLGNGVVVQVTGELSNDGQPMRRFTQTFVLAAQAPKKYYVHNDIFRYQDMYSDEEVDGESGRSENDDDQDTETIDTTTSIGQQPTIFYPLVTPTGQTVSIQPFTQSSQMNGVVHDEVIQGIPGQPNPILQSAPAITQPPQQSDPSTIPLEPLPIITPPTSIPISTTTILPSVEMKDQITIIETPIKLIETVASVTEIILIEKEQPDTPKPQEKIEIVKEESIKQTAANEPKTYANLVKSGTSELSFASAMSSTPPSMIQSGRPRHSTLSPPIRFQQEDQRRSDNNSGGSSGQQQQRNRPINRERRSSNANSQSFGDHHQLFLGNLPHHATEDDLKALFSKFGVVADLRIHSKPGPKGLVSGTRAPPNYGFITYEDPESVHNCLSNTPLHYPDQDGQKLNIEEKKTRSRAQNEGGMSNNMRGNNGPPSRSIGGGGGLSLRGSSNSGMPRGGGGGSGGRGGGGGGRGGFNRSDRGGSSVTRTGGGGGQGGGGGGNTSSNSNTNYGRR